jgi:catechol 2,3-dioxygenase-like lactoylglutathione lyase family enzyme
MPKILHVLETCIYGDDLPAMERFYTDVLGLEKMADEKPRHVFFRITQMNALLVFNRTETDRSTDVPAHGMQGRGHVAFAIQRSDLDPWRTKLLNAGIEIEREIDWPGGAHSIYFRDPADNSVELATDELWS